MDGQSFRFRWNEDLQAILAFQTAPIKGLFHRKSRGEQPYPLEALRKDRFCGGIGNMEQWNGEMACHRVCDAMHGIGANEEEISASTLNVCCSSAQEGARLLPTVLML